MNPIQDLVGVLKDLFNWRYMLEDITNVFTRGSYLDRFVYVLFIVFMLFVLLYVIDVIVRIVDAVRSKIQKIAQWTDEDFRLKKKAERIAQEDKAFEEELSKKEAIEHAKQRKIEAQKVEKARQEREVKEAKEMIACAELDYSFFTPENGYPAGPSFKQRIQLEESRIKITEGRKLTPEERVSISKGLSADGSPFGSAPYQELFDTLWSSQQRIIEKQKEATKPTEHPTQSKGTVITFPGYKK